MTGEPLVGRLLAYDALEESFRTFKVNRDPECAACSIPQEQLASAEYDDLCLPHPIQPPERGSESGRTYVAAAT